MATTAKWAQPESIQTALDTGLNALGAGNTALSGAIANETDLYQYINLELVLASVDWSAATGLDIQVWFLTVMDGTNYEDGSAGTPGTINPRPPDAIFPCRKVNGAQRIQLTNVPIPPLGFKMLFKNDCSAAMAASGNTLKYRRHNEQGV